MSIRNVLRIEKKKRVSADTNITDAYKVPYGQSNVGSALDELNAETLKKPIGYSNTYVSLTSGVNFTATDDGIIVIILDSDASKSTSLTNVDGAFTLFSYLNPSSGLPTSYVFSVPAFKNLTYKFTTNGTSNARFYKCTY